MAAKKKTSLKSWMLVYVGFTLALTAANSDVNQENDVSEAMPEVSATDIATDKSFFQPIIKQPSRHDI